MVASLSSSALQPAGDSSRVYPASSAARSWMEEGMASHVPGDSTLYRIIGRWKYALHYMCIFVTQMSWPVSVAEIPTFQWIWRIGSLPAGTQSQMWECAAPRRSVSVEKGEREKKKRRIKLEVQHSTGTSGPRRRDQYVRHLPALFNRDSWRKQLLSFYSFDIMTRVWRQTTY